MEDLKKIMAEITIIRRKISTGYGEVDIKKVDGEIKYVVFNIKSMLQNKYFSGESIVSHRENITDEYPQAVGDIKLVERENKMKFAEFEVNFIVDNNKLIPFEGDVNE